MLLVILLCCALGHDGPASPDSPSAEIAQQTAELGALAAQIEAQAIELEELASASRSLRDPAARARAAADIAARVQEMEATDARLQERLSALDAQTRSAAGDPAPPGATPPAE